MLSEVILQFAILGELHRSRGEVRDLVVLEWSSSLVLLLLILTDDLA